jgi:hypothetical protein
MRGSSFVDWHICSDFFYLVTAGAAPVTPAVAAAAAAVATPVATPVMIPGTPTEGSAKQSTTLQVPCYQASR